MSPKSFVTTEHDDDAKPVDVAVALPSMPSFLQNMTDEERARMERKLVRKIDFRLLVMTFAMYVLNYLDRNNIASAKLGGLEEDLGLRGNQFQVGRLDSILRSRLRSKMYRPRSVFSSLGIF